MCLQSFFCLRALKDGIINIKACNSVGNYTYVRVPAKALWPGHIIIVFIDEDRLHTYTPSLVDHT